MADPPGVDDLYPACLVESDGVGLEGAGIQARLAWVALDAEAEVWLDTCEADADSGLVHLLERSAWTGDCAGDLVADNARLLFRINRRCAVELSVFDSEFFDRFGGTGFSATAAPIAGVEKLVLGNGTGGSKAEADGCPAFWQMFVEVVGEWAEHPGEACGEEAAAAMWWQVFNVFFAHGSLKITFVKSS